MAGKFFGIPFASTGDKTAVPDSVQPDGSVSYSEGFGFDYERADTDPAYKPVPREQTNQLYFDLTQAVGIIQKQGFADWTTDAQPYAINAAVRHNGVNWYSLIATNNDEPGVGPGATSWKVLGASVDTLNAPIATVAAASTINLTTGAPETSQLAISGTGVNINGFTVAANRFFIVKMNGANNTLVNSASLVTGRGTNIAVSAGDTFLMRSTAANTVEILGFVENPTPRASLTTNGWQRLQSGLIIQWGSRLNAGSVTFPVAFTATPYSVTLGAKDGAGSDAYMTALSNTGFTITGVESGETNYYIAIGV